MSQTLLPGSTIGVLGGGQLGRMLTSEAQRMGYRVVSWIGGADSGPAATADFIIEEPFNSEAGLARFIACTSFCAIKWNFLSRFLASLFLAL